MKAAKCGNFASKIGQTKNSFAPPGTLLSGSAKIAAARR
jgi:hypothetical protein